MDVNEVLQFVDRLVVEHTGNHLDDVQRAVVEGTWQKQTYDDIANNNNISKNHASDTGYQLWKLLSKVLDQDIKKSNFRSTLERVRYSQNICINNNHNFGSQTLNQSNKKSPKTDKKTKLKSIYHDLTQSPKIIKFYNREPELTKLSHAIFTQKTPLISILGLSGIGKTTLVKRFIDLNLQ
jgi:signal recognition particle GTPase